MRILVAEDSKTSLSMLKKVLEKFGHNVIAVDSGQKAIAFMDGDDPPALVLLDWMMPGVSGIDVLNAMGKKREGVYVIMLTSKSDAEDIAFALDSGANDFIQKPFNPKELRARVDVGVRVLAAESKLKQAKERMSEFVGVVSHDLRNPIGSLLSMLELLSDDSELMDEMLPIMSDTCEKALGIVRDLLDISALENSRIHLEMNLCGLRDICKTVLKQCEHLAEKKSMKVTLHLSDEGMMMADTPRLCQVLDNLLSNAIKFTPREGEVKLSVVLEGNTVHFSVEDNGVGIAPEFRDILFSKEHHSSTHGTEGERGTGYGLPLVAELVKLFGGNLEVESEVGKGSRFFFSLPRE